MPDRNQRQIERRDKHGSFNVSVRLPALNATDGCVIDAKLAAKFDDGDVPVQTANLSNVISGQLRLKRAHCGRPNMVGIGPVLSHLHAIDRAPRDAESASKTRTRLNTAKSPNLRNSGFVQLCVLAAADVLRVSDGLRVVGVHARLLFAEMVQNQTSRHRAIFPLVSNDMGLASASSVSDAAVPHGVSRALPNPARGDVTAIFNDVTRGRIRVHVGLLDRLICRAGDVRSVARHLYFTRAGANFAAMGVSS